MDLVDVLAVEQGTQHLPAAFDQNVRHTALAEFDEQLFQALLIVVGGKSKHFDARCGTDAAGARDSFGPGDDHHVRFGRRAKKLAVCRQLALRGQHDPRGSSKPRRADRQRWIIGQGGAAPDGDGIDPPA